MKLKNPTAFGWIVAGLLGHSLMCTALAEPVTLAPYPAPGGNSATTNGQPTTGPGGRAITYTGFDPTAYDELYYVIGDYPGGTFTPSGPRLWTDATPDLLSFNSSLSDLVGGVSVWTGTTTLNWFNGGQLVSTSVGTRFTLQVTDLTSNPLSLLPAASISGMPASVGGALDVPDGGFIAYWAFELQNPQSGLYGAARSVYDALQTNPAFSLNSSVGGAFYSTSPVPLPAAAWLLLSGLGGLVALGRSKGGRAAGRSDS